MTAAASLHAYFDIAYSALTPGVLEELERAFGVAPEIASGLITEYPPVGIQGDMLLTPVAEGAEPDGTFAIHDLIAWRPDAPDQWRAWRGAGALLNPDAVHRAAYLDEILIVHATPLDWLRDRCRGVVVLDWSAHIPWHLGIARRILAADAAVERKLRAAWRIKDKPTIMGETRESA